MKASCTPCEASATVSFSGHRVAIDAPAQFGEFRFRNIHMKRTNGGLAGRLFAGPVP